MAINQDTLDAIISGLNSMPRKSEIDTPTNNIDLDATKETSGLMSAKDKAKLDKIDEEANHYVHETTSGYKHIPAGGAAGYILKWESDGTAKWAEEAKYGLATTEYGGLMSSTDKSNLDEAVEKLKTIDDNANYYRLPTASNTTKGGVTTTSTVTSTSGLIACPIINGVPYYHDTTVSYDLPTASNTTKGGVITTSTVTSTSGLTACPIIAGVPYYNDGSTYALRSLYSDTTINFGRKSGTTVGAYSVAEGYSTTASGSSSHAEGWQTIASSGYSHSEGNDTTASGVSSHSEGNQTTASNEGSHAEGFKTTASGQFSHAEGKTTTASGDASHAEGDNTTASGQYSHVEGYSDNKLLSVITDFSSETTNDDIIAAWKTNKFSLAKGDSSHSEGSNTLALGNYSHAEGYNTTASGAYSHAEGLNTTASGSRSHAEGYSTTASGSRSHAEGYITKASGSDSHAEGLNTTASGSRSHAEGYNTTASGISSHAEGSASNKISNVITDFSSETTNDDIIAAWKTNKFSLAKGENSHSEGYNTLAIGLYSHAEGSSTTASGSTSHAEGYNTTTSGNYSHAEGYNTTASGAYSHAEGYNTTASGISSHAEGNQTTASKETSHAEGLLTIADGHAAHAEGGNCTDDLKFLSTRNVTINDETTIAVNGPRAYGINSHAEGCQTLAYSNASHAEGFKTTASGQYSHAEGSSTTASGNYSHAEGQNTTASGDNSHAEGYSTNKVTDAITDFSSSTSNDDIINAWTDNKFSLAKGNYSHSEGSNTLALRDDAHAEGYFTKAIGNWSHAEGQGTTASGGPSHAEGQGTTASGHYSHAEGRNTTASGDSSHAEGHSFYKCTNAITDFSYNTTNDDIITAWTDKRFSLAKGKYSHSEGSDTLALGDHSHAEGYSTTASGYCSHAEGSHTTASDSFSHAEGTNTTAVYISHAEGQGTTASGHYSHAEGYYTTASNDYSHSGGKYNVAMKTGALINNTTGTAFVIGNGTSDTALSNAFSVQFDGTVKAASTITASTTADYAEFFEWIDENPDAEDRVGYFVTLDGDKIRIATNEDDYILGVVSGEPFVLGNGDCDTWNGMFLRDEFRRTIYEPAPKMVEVEIKEEQEEKYIDEETGEEKTRTVEVLVGYEYKEVPGEYEGTRPKLNPDYDHTQKYISRFERKEWAPVGMLGVLAVRHDGTAKVNGYVTANENGIATACDRTTENSYRVIKSNSESVVEIIFR